MSILATAWAFEQRGLGPEQKWVLVVLADYHRPEGDCLVTESRVAEVAELSVDQVRTIIGSLANLDLLRIEGPGWYTLACDFGLQGQTFPGAAP